MWTPSEFISIRGNTISSNHNAGILLSNLRNSSVVGNNITNNDIGIWLYTYSDIIEFYRNNFINNTLQVDTFPDDGHAWDNGIRGNYWDDYNGTDNDGDGIDDTPYINDENNQDNYPLMSPTGTSVDLDLKPPKPSITSPKNRTYHTNQIPLNFTADEPVSWMGYSLNDQQNVTVTGKSTSLKVPEGKHKIVVYAEDKTGNMGASKTVYFTVDKPVSLAVWFLIALGVVSGVIVLWAYYRKR